MPNKVLQSRDVVRRIYDGKGNLRIAFCQHDGIFYVSWVDIRLQKRIREAWERRETISFTYDAKLRILSVL